MNIKNYIIHIFILKIQINNINKHKIISMQLCFIKLLL